jgi:pimeloyl-ACP methyl ester carboxylesterase
MAGFAYRLIETSDGREVGYRVGGSGPPAVLLHESPRSSAALLPLAERLAGRFTVYALDTPGFGLSTPLPMLRPAAEDFASALAHTLDALGLDRVPVYGTHTGAVIAMAFAHTCPARCTAVALDGYPVFTPAEQEIALASYLAPLRPEWDGTHLAWLWGRVKDQYSFYPWNQRGQSARLPRPLPPLAWMQSVVVDFLSAGDVYRDAYASAFRYLPLEPAARVAVPCGFLARSDDLLFPHLDRLGAVGPQAEIIRLGVDRDAWAAAVGDVLARGAGDAPGTPRESPLAAAPGRVARRIVADTSLRVTGAGEGAPLVVLHALPGAAAGTDALARSLSDGRRVVALDLPGIGVSAPLAEATLPALVAALRAAIDAAGIDGCEMLAMGESCAAGAALAASLGPRVGALTLVDPVPDGAGEALRAAFPDVAPRRDGTHLLAAWHMLRDRELWWPWTDTTPEAARGFGTDPDVPRLHAVLTEWLRGGIAGRATLDAALSVPLGSVLAPVAPRTTIQADPSHRWGAAARDLARLGARHAPPG